MPLRTGMCFPWILISAALFLGGCQSVAYYSQLARGQWEILSGRQPVADLLADEDTEASLREQLLYADRVLQFARESLALPVGDTYSSYVDLRRSPALWAVYAAPRFSVKPHTWCFPIAGCAPYRGYFSRADAEAFAGEMKEAGYDTYIAGVRAYSTLGWFSDPLLNTFLYDDDIDLAALLFHELAHQVAYVPGETDFNEGLASFVEREGTHRWMHHIGRPELLEEQARRQAARRAFVALVAEARQELRALYTRESGAAALSQGKAAILGALQTRFRNAAEDSPALQNYAGWIGNGLNNAKLASVATYHDRIPAFERLFRESDGFSAFYEICRALANLDPASRAQQMHNAANPHQTRQQAPDS